MTASRVGTPGCQACQRKAKRLQTALADRNRLARMLSRWRPDQLTEAQRGMLAAREDDVQAARADWTAHVESHESEAPSCSA